MNANSEEYATKVWCSNNRALWFLIWLGLLCLPKQCSRGHNWKFSNNQDGAYCDLHCTAKLDEVYPITDEEAEEPKGNREDPERPIKFDVPLDAPQPPPDPPALPDGSLEFPKGQSEEPGAPDAMEDDDLAIYSPSLPDDDGMDVEPHGGGGS